VIIHAIAVHDSFLGAFLVFMPGSGLRISTYQGVGRSIMVTAIVLSALYPQSWKQLTILALAIVAMLAVGSRAHLFTTFLLLVATLLLAALAAKRRMALVAFICVAAAGIWFGWSVFLETRAAEILDLGTSTSWQGRREVLAIALDVIRKSPVLGEFGYHFREVGAGGYAHNALSAWTEFGVVGFVMFCALICYFTTLSLKRLVSLDTATPLWRAAFGLNFASAILVVGAEPVFSAVPALGWGFTINALLEEQRNHVVFGHA
jgi:O-antigen ligase